MESEEIDYLQNLTSYVTDERGKAPIQNCRDNLHEVV
jgi:hypothetical protein